MRCVLFVLLVVGADSVEIGVVPPDPDADCLFPFLLNGVNMYNCTIGADGRGWCQTKNWGYRYCTEEEGFPTPIPTTPKPGSCIFPFEYKDNIYSMCTKTDSRAGKAWCATASQYSSDQWRYCTDEETSVLMRYNTCFIPFTYKGEVHYTCTTEDSIRGRPWCPTSDNFSRDGEWKYCTATEQMFGVNFEWERNKCVYPFTYNDVQYTECTAEGSKFGRKWCPTTSNLADNPKEWKYCTDEDQPFQN